MNSALNWAVLYYAQEWESTQQQRQFSGNFSNLSPSVPLHEVSLKHLWNTSQLPASIFFLRLWIVWLQLIFLMLQKDLGLQIELNVCNIPSNCPKSKETCRWRDISQVRRCLLTLCPGCLEVKKKKKQKKPPIHYPQFFRLLEKDLWFMKKCKFE